MPKVVVDKDLAGGTVSGKVPTQYVIAGCLRNAQ